MATDPDDPDNSIPRGHLLPVFSSRFSEDAISADIIAIHGLGTTSPKTWQATGHQACGTQRPLVNWLCDDDMLPGVVPSANILTFTWNADYYKNAPVVRIQDVANVLLSKLQSQRDKEDTHSRPLIFIASCFGGLIVTKALEIANIKGNEYHKLVVATSGVVFLGSPLQGTRAGTAAQWRVMLGGVLGESPSQTLLQDLDGSTKVLRETSEAFVKMITSPPMQTMTKCFWESKPSQLANAVLPAGITKALPRLFTPTQMILVEEDSACLFGRPRQQLDAAHVMMNKFRGPTDANFELVSSTVKEMVGEAKRITVAQREAINIHNEHFMVFRRVNPLFTGRAAELKALQQSLCPSHSTNPQTVWPRTYVIHGMGGAGKSEVALKFAHENRAEFWGVFWLDASSESSLARGFVDIAEKCNLHDKSFEGARSWLQETAHSWLLILDNADDPSIDYAMFLPAASKGHVLITSRVEECASLQTAGKDYYEGLSRETAVELLSKACGMNSSLYDTHAVEALEIVDLLGSHALAIHQAGASIKRGICDLRDYKNKFEAQRERLLRIRPGQARSRYGDVYSTFEVTAAYLSDLSERKDQTATDALGLLNCYACMSFTAFPEKAFEEAWRNSRKIRRDVQPESEEASRDLSPWHRSHLPSFMRQCSSEDFDTLSLREAQSLLASLSIVVLDLPAHTTRMHPVTHMWAMDRLEKQEDLTKSWLGALAVLCCSIENPCRPGTRWEQEALWVQLQPHIESIKRPSSGDYLCNNEFDLRWSFVRLIWVLYLLKSDKAAIEMLQTWVLGADQSWTGFAYGEEIGHLYGRCLYNCGDFKEATKTLEHVVKMHERLAEDDSNRLAEDDSSRLTAQHSLALAYLGDGRVGEAVELFEYIVEIKSKMAVDYPNRLASEQGLATAYQENGQIEEAVKLYEYVVKIEEKSLAEDHPSLLRSQFELVLAYIANGKPSEAIDLLEHIVEVRKKTLDEDNRERLASEYQLALAYRRKGQIDKAIKLLEHIVKIKLTKNHDDRLGPLQTLAFAYRENGQIDKAMKPFEHIVKIEETELPENDRSLLYSQYDLAKAYIANGRINKAIELLKHGIKIKLAENHSDRDALQHSLALAYQKNGQTDEAIELFEDVIKTRKMKCTEKDRSLLVSQYELACSYIAKGKSNEAIELLKHVVKIKLAENHSDRIAPLRALARAYRENGQIDKTIETLEHIVKINSTEDQHVLLDSQCDLALAYIANEKTSEAIELLEHIVKIKLAENHCDRTALVHALAFAYLENKRANEAVELLKLVVTEDHPHQLASQHALTIAYRENGQVEKAVELESQLVPETSSEQSTANSSRCPLFDQRVIATPVGKRKRSDS